MYNLASFLFILWFFLSFMGDQLPLPTESHAAGNHVLQLIGIEFYSALYCMASIAKGLKPQGRLVDPLLLLYLFALLRLCCFQCLYLCPTPVYPATTAMSCLHVPSNRLRGVANTYIEMPFRMFECLQICFRATPMPCQVDKSMLWHLHVRSFMPA